VRHRGQHQAAQPATGYGKAVHVLGYFLDGVPTTEFRLWLGDMPAEPAGIGTSGLAERLESLGKPVALAEVEKLGRSIAGARISAKLMVEKGVRRLGAGAFEIYLGEGGKAYVEREEPGVVEGIRKIREAGGLAAVAHPIRLGRAPGRRGQADRRDARLRPARHRGLPQRHSRQDVALFLELARRLGMAVTGGTDLSTAAPNRGSSWGRGSTETWRCRDPCWRGCAGRGPGRKRRLVARVAAARAGFGVGVLQIENGWWRGRGPGAEFGFGMGGVSSSGGWGDGGGGSSLRAL